MAAKFCDTKGPCYKCKHYKVDSEKGMVCTATPNAAMEVQFAANEANTQCEYILNFQEANSPDEPLRYTVPVVTAENIAELKAMIKMLKETADDVAYGIEEAPENDMAREFCEKTQGIWDTIGWDEKIDEVLIFLQQKELLEVHDGEIINIPIS